MTSEETRYRQDGGACFLRVDTHRAVLSSRRALEAPTSPRPRPPPQVQHLSFPPPSPPPFLSGPQTSQCPVSLVAAGRLPRAGWRPGGARVTGALVEPRGLCEGTEWQGHLAPRGAGPPLTAYVFTDDSQRPTSQRSAMPRMGHQPCPPRVPSTGPSLLTKMS